MLWLLLLLLLFLLLRIGKKNDKWDLPTVVNLNARSLSCEKMDELQITVETSNVSKRGHP